MLELTGRQEKFCRAFVDVANGAYAAREAGYAPRSARMQGHRLLKDRRVRARIADIQA
ncbi:MAG: terminase small subunit [Rhodospirillales bacterium]|nr:terminase small subunit [Rhodospirillales bacterium]